MVKRTARKRKAEDSSSAFFTTTNVTPQISEHNISDMSAFFRASIRGTIHANCHASVSVIAREKAGKVNVPPTDTKTYRCMDAAKENRFTFFDKRCGRRQRSAEPPC